MELLPVDLLAEAFMTIAPMEPADARRRAGVAIETIGMSRGRSDLLQLGLALRALDGGPLHRFTRASQADRERMLMGWAGSPLPQLRSAFQALKRFALFLAYADPGADPSAAVNRNWDPLGYAPPVRPDPPAEPSVHPMAVDRDDRSVLRLEADVVVVGSGAGGGVVAARLASGGASVLVVEAAAHWAEPRMPVSEGEAWRELLLDRGSTSTTDLAVTILAGATLGGGTTVNWTTTIRAPEWIREEWDATHGLVGFAGAEGDGDYARLEQELDIRPPSVVPPKDQLILDGAAALGWEASVTSRNAGPCTECGGCGFGCARGSKRSGLRVHLADAERAGARILAGARVSRVTQRGGAVEGVAGRLEPGGRPFSVRAPRVVVSAGGLRTPIILERSGVAHPCLGRNLLIHPTVAIAPRLLDRADAWIGPLQAARSLEFVRPGPAWGIGPAHGGFVIEAAPPHPGLAMAALPWAGRDESVAAAAMLAWRAPLIAIIRDHGAGSVRATRAGRAQITYRLDPRDGESARRALVEMSRLARAGGATEVLAAATPGPTWRDGEDFDAFLAALTQIDVGPNRLSLFSAHQMGSARAGGDPRTSATDPWGRVRSDERGGLLRGAYVADASLFPTAPGVNPMLSVMAIAERVARGVASDEVA